MSSHHIVREKQEPALLLLSLDNFDDELLGQLLEWSPTVIATAKTAEQVYAFSIKIDVIADDYNQADNQSNIKQIYLNGQSTANAVLHYLVEAGYPAVNIIADELDIAATEQYCNRINIVWFCHDEKVFPIRSGFKKWKPKGEQIRVLSDTSTLEFDGLERVTPNIYATTADGFYSFTFPEPLLFIAEQII